MATSWPHSPFHNFIPGEIYIVTAGTLYKKHYFHDDARLQLLQANLLTILDDNKWVIQAWAVFVNHYHFIARAPQDGQPLDALIKELHSITAHEVNRLDGVSGRQVWFQYWDDCISFEKSWLARLNYVNSNAVHHGLVRIAADYPCCSAAWFEQNTSSSFCRVVKSFRYDRLKIADDF